MRTNIEVQSPNVRYTDTYIEAKYCYETTHAYRHGNTVKVTPVKQEMKFRTEKKVPRVGVMLVGWGGNNGTTITAAVLANKLGLFWHNKEGKQCANYYGSLTQSSTVSLSRDVHVPLGHMLPMLDPNNIVFNGWDISGMNLGDAMQRARVLEYELQKQLQPNMETLKPLPSIYDPDFIAANQATRADNIIEGTKWQQIERIRQDIRDFKDKESLEKVIVLWTANTERYCAVEEGLNDTAANLMDSIKNDAKEVSPSTLFAVASILERCAYINGSPQNTFVPGCIELAEQHQVFIAGDDFKSGQTKLKSVLVDFLVSAGIKPRSIVSYNHLGNNDGKNLSAPQQFQSKEISKSNVVDDVVKSNNILYKKGEKPDHTVVIKYVPHVGDSKRAMDEYCSEILCGGSNTIIIHNTCEDSLLAAPIIIDLVILTELCQRIQFKAEDSAEWETFHPVLSLLSYLVKAPLVPPGAPVVNALFSQRSAIENLLRACLALPPNSHLNLEHRIKSSGSLKRSLEVDSTETTSKNAKKALYNGNYTNGDYSNGDYTNGVSNGSTLICHR